MTDLRPFFEFMYATGCRLGVVQKMRWEHVTKDCSEIKIPASNTKNRLPLTLPLAGPIPEPIAAKLQECFRDDKPVFDSTNYRPVWAKACVGTWDEKTRTAQASGFTTADALALSTLSTQASTKVSRSRLADGKQGRGSTATTSRTVSASPPRCDSLASTSPGA